MEKDSICLFLNRDHIYNQGKNLTDSVCRNYSIYIHKKEHSLDFDPM